MRTIRLFAVLGALMGLYLAAALQSGPEQVDANICGLARRWHMAIPEHCAPWIDSWASLVIGIIIILCVGFLAWDGVSFFRSLPPRPKRASHSQLFIGIMEAIYWIAEKSAWGRWQDAKRRASGETSSELSKFSAAEHVLRAAAENGEILLKGREKKSVEYRDFDQHFWRTAHFEIQSNPAALWRARIRPLTGADVSISEYDDVLVERRRIEFLWPRRDWRCGWLTFRLNLRAVWKRMKDDPKTSTNQPEAVPLPPAQDIQTASPELGTPEIAVTSQAPPDWERLFVIGDDGRSVWLRFLPDTKNEKADTLLLIVYGHKVLLGNNRVGIHSAYAAVQKTVSVSPSKSYAALGALARMNLFSGTVLDNEDYAAKHLGSSLMRVGLSQGGMYELTEYGERTATGLANDLISRA